MKSFLPFHGIYYTQRDCVNSYRCEIELTTLCGDISSKYSIRSALGRKSHIY